MTRCTDRVYRDEMQGPVSQTGNNKFSSFSHFYNKNKLSPNYCRITKLTLAGDLRK